LSAFCTAEYARTVEPCSASFTKRILPGTTRAVEDLGNKNRSNVSRKQKGIPSQRSSRCSSQTFIRTCSQLCPNPQSKASNYIFPMLNLGCWNFAFPLCVRCDLYIKFL